MQKASGSRCPSVIFHHQLLLAWATIGSANRHATRRHPSDSTIIACFYERPLFGPAIFNASMIDANADALTRP
jgi:hypothetical protein